MGRNENCPLSNRKYESWRRPRHRLKPIKKNKKYYKNLANKRCGKNKSEQGNKIVEKGASLVGQPVVEDVRDAGSSGLQKGRNDKRARMCLEEISDEIYEENK